jgi:hypothetical protein
VVNGSVGQVTACPSTCATACFPAGGGVPRAAVAAGPDGTIGNPGPPLPVELPGGAAVTEATPVGTTPAGDVLGAVPAPVCTFDVDAHAAPPIMTATVAAATPTPVVTRLMPVGRNPRPVGCVRLVTDVLRPEPHRVRRSKTR